LYTYCNYFKTQRKKCKHLGKIFCAVSLSPAVTFDDRLGLYAREARPCSSS